EDVYATELRAQRRAYPSPGAMLRPRVAVGVTEVFEIVTACVTGDRMETSVGISLREMARLMKDLGCVSAMSFSDDLGCALAVAPEVVERLGKEVAPFIKSADDLARAATLWTWRVRGLA
ncbi:phosphodiester glycosidase family protein, partial [bacterium]|nr:phosphodiester glycosidase family protein [bacterium]